MMSILSLKLPKRKKLLVKEVDPVSVGTILVEGEEEEKETVAVTKVFKISPAQISEVMVKKIGEQVEKGEVLAEKKSLFGKSVLKSPISGRVVEISQVLGEVTLAKGERPMTILSPVKGRVKEIRPTEIQLEFTGEVFQGKESGGEQACGVVENVAAEVGILELPSAVKKKILVAQNFSPAVLAKAWALEAAGVISLGFPAPPPLSFLVLVEQDLDRLKDFQGKRAVLDPERKRLIVLKE